MTGYVLRRLIGVIPVLAGLSLLSFLLLHLVPVDPAEAALNLSNPGASEEAVQALREEMGLHEPILAQYGTWLYKAVQLDFGTSLVSHQPVGQELGQYLPATLQLALSALLLLLVMSLPLGILSAAYKGSWLDRVIQFIAVSAASVPSFWIGFLLIYLVSMQLNLLPLMGRGDWTHLVLPSFTLALAYASPLIRLLRTGILEHQHQPYIQAARLRGIRNPKRMGKYVLKSALPPVITALGITIGHLLAGTVIVESVFAWPGVGRYLVESVANRDYPVIQSYVLLMGTMFILLNLAADLLCAALDPRSRLKEGMLS